MLKAKVISNKPLKVKISASFPDINVGGTTDHSKLNNLDYEHSGHIGFVKAEEGKMLSTNDFTDSEKAKLEGIEEGANKYILPSDVVQDVAYNHTDNNYTDEEKAKLKSLDNYTLPIASNENLGGIKVGDNLEITEDGTLNAKSGGLEPIVFEYYEKEANRLKLEKVIECYNNGVVPAIYYSRTPNHTMFYCSSISVTSTLVDLTFLQTYRPSNGKQTLNGVRIYATVSNGTVGTVNESTTTSAYLTTALDTTGKGVLTTDNTISYTPTANYHPATKKYVDDKVSSASAVHYTWEKTTDSDAISMFQQVYNAYKNGEILNVDLKDGVKRYKLMSICQPNNMASEYWCQFRTIDWYTDNVDMIFLQTINAVLNVSGDIVQSIDIKESVNEFGLIREYNGTRGALPVDNTKEFVPQNDYEPATKRYVDLTHYQRISGYSTNKTQVLKNINGTLTWVSE